MSFGGTPCILPLTQRQTIHIYLRVGKQEITKFLEIHQCIKYRTKCKLHLIVLAECYDQVARTSVVHAVHCQVQIYVI